MLEENKKAQLLDIGLGDDFVSDLSPTAKITEAIIKRDYITQKSFCTVMETMNEMKR